jgi:hypothetical protein
MARLLDVADALFAPGAAAPPHLDAFDLARLACVCRALRPLAAAAPLRRPASDVALDCLAARDFPRLCARVARALARAHARRPHPLAPLPHFLASIRYTPVGDAAVHLVYSTQRHGHGHQGQGRQGHAQAPMPCIDLWTPRARACDVLHPAAHDGPADVAAALRRHPFFETPCFRTQTARVRVRVVFLPADLFADADDPRPHPVFAAYPRTHIQARQYDDSARGSGKDAQKDTDDEDDDDDADAS